MCPLQTDEFTKQTRSKAYDVLDMKFQTKVQQLEHKLVPQNPTSIFANEIGFSLFSKIAHMIAFSCLPGLYTCAISEVKMILMPRESYHTTCLRT